MIYLLDTNTCIKYLNASSLLIREKIEKINPNDISICSVVKAELFYGNIHSQQTLVFLSYGVYSDSPYRISIHTSSPLFSPSTFISIVISPSADAIL